MGIRKKCSRFIAADGVLYRYRVTEERDGFRLNIGIQRVEPAGQRLITSFDKPLMWTEVAPGHRHGEVLPHAVTPRVIRSLILAALSKGWHPAASGDGFFFLKADQIVPNLPNPE